MWSRRWIVGMARVMTAGSSLVSSDGSRIDTVADGVAVGGVVGGSARDRGGAGGSGPRDEGRGWWARAEPPTTPQDAGKSTGRWRGRCAGTPWHTAAVVLDRWAGGTDARRRGHHAVVRSHPAARRAPRSAPARGTGYLSPGVRLLAIARGAAAAYSGLPSVHRRGSHDPQCP